MTIQKHEITWLAGFIDGEGCFYIGKTKTPKIQIAQKDAWPLLKVQQLVGGTIYDVKGSCVPGRRYNLLMIVGKQAIGVMMTLYPFLSPRRQAKIIQILGIWRAIPLRGKSNIKTHCKYGHELTPKSTFQKSDGSGRECTACSKMHKANWYERSRLKLV